MCLIVEKRLGDKLEFADVKDWCDANADGWGIMFTESEQVTVVKGFGLKKLWAAVCQHADRSYYLHLRMATHGAVKDGNTHPYLVGNGVWLMHNGIVDIDCASNPNRSDTWHFIEQVLKPLLADSADTGATIRAPWFRFLLESYMGTSNRLVLMDGNGSVTFNNANWHDFKKSGMRVSNTYALGGYKSALHPYEMDIASYLGRLKGRPKDANKGWEWSEKDERVESTKKDENEGNGWQRDPWEIDHAPDYDRTPEHDVSYMMDMDEEGIAEFVYSEPERAAAALYSLLCSS